MIVETTTVTPSVRFRLRISAEHHRKHLTTAEKLAAVFPCRLGSRVKSMHTSRPLLYSIGRIKFRYEVRNLFARERAMRGSFSVGSRCFSRMKKRQECAFATLVDLFPLSPGRIAFTCNDKRAHCSLCGNICHSITFFSRKTAFLVPRWIDLSLWTENCFPFQAADIFNHFVDPADSYYYIQYSFNSTWT